MAKKTKYPWHLAPSWSQWAATDRNGDKCWHQEEPKPNSFLWVSSRAVYRFANGKATADWQNSLEKRPDNA